MNSTARIRTTAVLTALAIAGTIHAGYAQASTDNISSDHLQFVETVTGTDDIAASKDAAGAAAEATVPTPAGNVTVHVPDTADGAVRMSTAAGAVSLGLPGAASSRGAVSSAGTVTYRDALKAADLAVQPTTDGGARTLITLKNDSAPRSYRFDLRLPEGSELEKTPDGGYQIAQKTADGVKLSLGSVEAPWAKDKNGNPVPTRYEIINGELVQHISTDEETHFPVVADPKLTYGVGIYFNASGAEWKSYAAGAATVAYFTNLASCNVLDKIPHAVVKRVAGMICGAVGLKTLKDYGNFLKHVVKDKSLKATACYQTRLMPKNGKLSKVSAGNCK
ncbi:hypothetical protein [Streptomyces alkaliterrae]|uniref:Uncharacterized protein n=1 Tax=Streptomyces alkaliterrae TaxID=2213162 RepID=A0A5P0YNX0_9ACTN|nr:hypothetical protein [Streptomyces alkaliterrae]MBB1262039.1 hypothetical protein [Streptomyces alkaliterrae]MQS02053.1 hypothetical protein [Streptomyces alkaliterrae]